MENDERLSEVRKEIEKLTVEIDALANRLTAGEPVRNELSAAIRRRSALGAEAANLAWEAGESPVTAPAYGPPSGSLL